MKRDDKKSELTLGTRCQKLRQQAAVFLANGLGRDSVAVLRRLIAEEGGITGAPIEDLLNLLAAFASYGHDCGEALRYAAVCDSTLQERLAEHRQSASAMGKGVAECRQYLQRRRMLATMLVVARTYVGELGAAMTQQQWATGAETSMEAALTTLRSILVTCAFASAQKLALEEVGIEGLPYGRLAGVISGWSNTLRECLPEFAHIPNESSERWTVQVLKARGIVRSLRAPLPSPADTDGAASPPPRQQRWSVVEAISQQGALLVGVSLLRWAAEERTRRTERAALVTNKKSPVKHHLAEKSEGEPSILLPSAGVTLYSGMSDASDALVPPSRGEAMARGARRTRSSGPPVPLGPGGGRNVTEP